MKKNFFIPIVFLLTLSGFFSACNEKDSHVDKSTELCHCTMDTLKGKWSWIKTHSSIFGNTTDNNFKSIVKIFGHNEDCSINYEVFVDDTLFYKGSFQAQIDRLNRKTVNINLPHEIYGNDTIWQFYFFNILEMGYSETSSRFEHKLSEDTLTFWDGADDGYYYIYKIIKSEE